MGDVLPFSSAGKRGSNRGNTLCREGHHQWRVVKTRQFDVKQGRLVTQYRCQRCGKTRVKAL